MTIPVISGLPSGNRMTVLQLTLNTVTVTVGTPLAMYIQPGSGGTLQVGYFVSHVPITLSALTGYGYLSTGTATGSVAFQLQTVAMTTATSGTGGTPSGSFANVSGATTGAITPTTTGTAMSPYVAPLANPPSYNAGQIFQIVAVATGANVANFCGVATLRVTTQV